MTSKTDRLFVGAVFGVPMAAALWLEPTISLTAIVAFGIGFSLSRWLYTP